MKPNDLNELLEEYVRRLSGISKVDINNILKKWDDLEFDNTKNLKNLGWTKATFDKEEISIFI